MAQYKDTFLLVDKVTKPLLKISQGFKKLDEQIAKSQSRMEKWQKRTENLEKFAEVLNFESDSYMISFEHIDNTFIFCEGGSVENMPDSCGNLYAVKVD